MICQMEQIKINEFSVPRKKLRMALSNIRLVKPVPVKGKLHLWECNTRVKVIGGSEK